MKVSKLQSTVSSINFKFNGNTSFGQNKTSDSITLSDVGLLGFGISYLSGLPKNIFKPKTKSEYVSVVAAAIGFGATVISWGIKFKNYIDTKK